MLKIPAEPQRIDMQMCSLEEAIQLACSPGFDASMYGGHARGGAGQTDEEMARQLANQSAGSAPLLIL